MSIRTLLAIGALAALPAVSLAQAPAVQSFAGGTQFSSFNGDGDTVGWFFNVNSPIIVTHLGFWDAGQDGLLDQHQVGIWDTATQTLLATTFVQAGTASPLVGQWRYEPIAALPLATGSYVIGAYYNANPPGPIDNYIASVSNIITGPEITLVGSAVDPIPSGGGPHPFTYPATMGAANGRFGPNFQYIPAPGSLGLLAAGGLLTLRRRR
jgi:hypothetical protein